MNSFTLAPFIVNAFIAGYISSDIQLVNWRWAVRSKRIGRLAQVSWLITLFLSTACSSSSSCHRRPRCRDWSWKANRVSGKLKARIFFPRQYPYSLCSSVSLCLVPPGRLLLPHFQTNVIFQGAGAVAPGEYGRTFAWGARNCAEGFPPFAICV